MYSKVRSADFSDGGTLMSWRTTASMHGRNGSRSAATPAGPPRARTSATAKASGHGDGSENETDGFPSNGRPWGSGVGADAPKDPASGVAIGSSGTISRVEIGSYSAA